MYLHLDFNNEIQRLLSCHFGAWHIFSGEREYEENDMKRGLRNKSHHSWNKQSSLLCKWYKWLWGRFLIDWKSSLWESSYSEIGSGAGHQDTWHFLDVQSWPNCLLSLFYTITCALLSLNAIKRGNCNVILQWQKNVIVLPMCSSTCKSHLRGQNTVIGLVCLKE